MAHTVSDAEARRIIGDPDRYTQLKYPWEEWMDGNWWLIRRGEDYGSNPDSLRTGLLNRARRHGVEVEVYKRGDAILFRFAASDVTGTGDTHKRHP